MPLLEREERRRQEVDSLPSLNPSLPKGASLNRSSLNPLHPLLQAGSIYQPRQNFFYQLLSLFIIIQYCFNNERRGRNFTHSSRLTHSVRKYFSTKPELSDKQICDQKTNKPNSYFVYRKHFYPINQPITSRDIQEKLETQFPLVLCISWN